jgi:formate dehydrogenase major subunit
VNLWDGGLARFHPTNSGRPDEEYLITLTAGRVLYHWHIGQIISRIERPIRRVGESFVDINPDTADQLVVSDGE